MTQYNTLNVNLSNSELNTLKSAIKNENELTLNLSSNLIGTNFPQNLLLTNAQVLKIRKAFANGSSATIKFSKTQFGKIVQSGGFLFSRPNMIDSGISSDLFRAPAEGVFP